MNNINGRRFNIKKFLLWIVFMVGSIIILIAFGFIPWGHEGILMGLNLFISS